MLQDIDIVGLWLLRALVVVAACACVVQVVGLAMACVVRLRQRLCRHAWSVSLPTQRGHTMSREDWLALQGEHPWDGEIRECLRCGRRDYCWQKQWSEAA